jgi:hypothetical protein
MPSMTVAISLNSRWRFHAPIVTVAPTVIPFPKKMLVTFFRDYAASTLTTAQLSLVELSERIKRKVRDHRRDVLSERSAQYRERRRTEVEHTAGASGMAPRRAA